MDVASDDEIADIERMLLQADDDNDKPSTSTSAAVKQKLQLTDLFGADHDVEAPKSKTKSTIHSGDTDSSEDEDERDFMNCKYNDYGRTINAKMKQAEETKKIDSIHVPGSSASSFSSKIIGQPYVAPRQPSDKPEIVQKPTTPARLPMRPQESIYCDPIFGLRIVQPLISSAVLKDRMEGRIAVTVPRLRLHTEHSDTKLDWVVAGVVIEKSAVRTTQKGDAFSIWTISDLRGDIKKFTLFLFRSAHTDLWKTTTGTVVGILNAKVLERKDEKVEAVLSIDNAKSIMILGQSKDLGRCRSKKKNGEQCTAIINSTDCDVCVFHMKQEYSQVSKRSEFNSTGLGRGLNELRNKVLGKSEVFYAGQSFSSIPAKKSAKHVKKDNDRMQSLSDYNISPYNAEINHSSGSSPLPGPSYRNPVVKKVGVAASLDANNAQRRKDLERLKLLQGSESPQFLLTPKIQKPEPPPDTPEEAKKKLFSFVPKLSGANLTFDLNITQKRNISAKQKAMELLKRKPLEKSNPNFIKYRGTEVGKKRAAEVLSTPTSTIAVKKAKVDIDETQRRRDYLIQMMNKKSSHSDLVENHQQTEQDKYFNTLEKKENMEERMMNTIEMKCKAVICKICKYAAFSASDYCKGLRHPVKVVDAIKRFYKCGDCNTRTVTLDRIPKLACKSCGGQRWVRTGMMADKIGTVGEHLSIRGDEEGSIGFATGKCNFNLLVPDE
ncbi:unnamed protein product [Diamesa tonsa]